MRMLRMKYLKDTEFLTGLLVSLALAFMLFIFAPLEIYLNNMQEFWYDIYTLIPVVTFVPMVALLLMTVVLTVLFTYNKKLYRAVVILEFMAYLILYVQGNILIKNLPPLDGTAVYWENYTKENIESIILIAVVIFTTLIIFWHFGIKKLFGIIAKLSSFITLVLLLTIVSIFVMQQGNTRKIQTVATTQNELEMSTDTNYIVLLLDTLEAGPLNAMMSDSPQYTDIFEDFTFYPNMMSAYSCTTLSVPFILTGEWFENNESLVDYSVNAYKNAKLLRMMEDDGFKMGVYEPDMPLTDESILRFDNMKTVTNRPQSLWRFARRGIRLTCFKYAPFGLKKYVMVNASDFAAFRMGLPDACSFWDSNVQFNNKLFQEEITFTDQKCFKFIHIDGAHLPFRYDKDVNIIDEKDGTYEGNMEACLTIIDNYLDKLKQSKVYDNSVIVLMSDHGYTGFRQNPAFFAKGLNEKHDFVISKAPVSHEDLQEAFSRLKNGKTGEDIFNWKIGDERERRYLWCEYLQEDHLVEYIQTGEAANGDTMHATGREFDQ